MQEEIDRRVASMNAAAEKRGEKTVIRVDHGSHCQWRIGRCTCTPHIWEKSGAPPRQLSMEGGE